MSDSVSASISGDKELIADLDFAAAHVAEQGEKVVSRGSLNIKNDWKRAWSGIAHAPRIPRSISYDITNDGATITGVTGPEDNAVTQGFLGAILEFGGIHSAPVPGGLPALEAEEPRFVAAVGDLAEKLL